MQAFRHEVIVISDYTKKNLDVIDYIEQAVKQKNPICDISCSTFVNTNALHMIYPMITITLLKKLFKRILFKICLYKDFEETHKR